MSKKTIRQQLDELNSELKRQGYYPEQIEIIEQDTDWLMYDGDSIYDHPDMEGMLEMVRKVNPKFLK